MDIGQPSWCHHHSMKMAFDSRASDSRSLVIKNNAAKLTVARIEPFRPTSLENWRLSWEIFRCKPTEEVVRGSVLLSDQDLCVAFGLGRFQNYRSSNWLVRNYGAQAAEQGKFIRSEEWLNVPGPGTGHDGDPNISVEVSLEMKKEILNLFEICGVKIDVGPFEPTEVEV